MMSLPVSVLQHPHWRVNFRPAEYKENLISSLAKCFEIVEKTKVSLRGWDYPHLGRDTQRQQGNNWVASWSDFMGHHEYWRLYQSGQFIHLASVREATEKEWRKKLEADMKSHLSQAREINWDATPGFMSMVNFIYNITEIYEFAARLCQSQVYSGTVSIKVELRSIKGFVLAAPWDRMWHNYYSASEDVLTTSSTYETDTLVAASREAALKSIVWFFERFGWLNPPEDAIARDQENLIRGRF